MGLKKVSKIWMNGKLVDWDNAKIHILSHVIHYGSSWFEGIRCYNTAKGSAIFRLNAHMQRLFDSLKIYRTEISYSRKEIEDAIFETIRVNKLKACYIRPIVYRGYGEVGVNPLPCPVDTAIAVWEWGKYLGEDALEKGIDVCISSWQRQAPNTFPAMAKAGGNYLNSQLIKLEALAQGYVEGIALDSFGSVSEGSGENLFLVKDNDVYTPPLISALLPGVTRKSVITLAKDLGFTVQETLIPREMIYIADELFFTGTAAEVTPIRSVDKIKIADGKPGPITRQIQKTFFDIVQNANDKYGWLTYVYND